MRKHILRRMFAEVPRPNSHMLPSRTEPNIRPNSSAFTELRPISTGHHTWIMSLILLKTWHYISRLLTYLLTYLLPHETWKAHCAHSTIEKLQKETPEFIPPQLWPSNLKPVDNSMWEMLQKKVYKTRITAQPIHDANDKWLLQWRHSPALGLIGPLCSQSLFQFIQITDAFYVHVVLQSSSHAVIIWIQIWRI